MSSNNWPTTKLEDITTKIGSGATPRGGKSSYKEMGISLIRSLNIYNLKFDYDDLAFIDHQQAEKLSNVEVEFRDVLLNITGASVTRCCMVPDDILPARVNQHVSIIRTNPDVACPSFVLYCLNAPHYQQHLYTLAQGGATRQALTQETIKNFEIPLPPLPTQRKIAAVLSAYDDLIENNTRRIAILEQMAQLIYREWFVHFRFPGHEDVAMVDSELGAIPAGWEVTKLGDVIELAYGKGLRKKDRISGPYPVYGSSGVIDSHNEPLVEGPGIIVGRKGNVGSVYWSDEGFCPIDTVFYVKTDVNLRYTYYNLQHQNFIGTHTAVPGLSRNQAYLLPFLLPDESILQKFEHIIDNLFAQKGNLESRNHVLRRTRDLLLPRLIAGEVDVTDLDIV